MKDTIIIAADPVYVALRDHAMVEYFFGVSAETLIAWHHTEGFPIEWRGEGGRGKAGYVPVQEARAFARRRVS